MKEEKMNEKNTIFEKKKIKKNHIKEQKIGKRYFIKAKLLIFSII